MAAVLLALASSALALDRVTLENGVRVLFYPLEGSKHVSIISFVPIGLCGDEKGRTQWSHLVEHLVVTSTGDTASMEINAETLGDWMHLDYIRPAETWKAGIAKQAAWLSIEAFDEEAVEREIGRVTVEVDSIASRGVTGKFALAAWAQAVRFGAKEVAVKGDVRDASAKDLSAYYRRNFLRGRAPLIVVGGSFEREKVLAELRARIGKLTRPEAPPPSEGSVEAPARITWDLSTRHEIFYWPLPPTTDRENAILAAGGIGFSASGVGALVEPAMWAGNRRWFVACLPAGEHAAADETVSGALERVLGDDASVRTGARVSLWMQTRQVDAPAMALEQATVAEKATAGRRPRFLAEGNLAIFAGRFEFHHAGALRKAVEDWNDEEVRRTLARLLDPKKRRILVIEPR